ncbi:MAG: CatB-related O-acetyltransferase [Lachnospiraceae bacterium]|nr:CatB-related O-acetyltransferase [Lachnospiraceae bacterium]
MSNTRIGRYTSIGPEVRTVLGKHPVDSKRAALHPAFYSGAGAMGYTYLDASDDKGAGFEEAAYLDKENGIQIVIGNDVWIGRGVMILEGVTIGDGAVIGAGTVVTKNIDPYGIYAGVPARKLRDRFDKDIAEKLLEYQWWNKGEAWIKEHISCFSDAWRLISVLEEEKE